MASKKKILTVITLFLTILFTISCGDDKKASGGDVVKKTFERGTAYYKLGKIDKAIVEFENTVLYDRKHKLAHYNLAVLYKEKGRTTEAIHEFEEYLKYSSEEEDKIERERVEKELAELKGKHK